MKIAIVSPYGLDRPGGVQDQARGLRDRLRTRGHETILIGPGRSDGTWTSVGGITDIEANDAVAPVCFEPGAIQRVKEAIAGVDVVHIHEPLLPVIGPAAWIGGDVATVGTFHAEPASIVRGVYKFGGPLLAHLVDRIDVLTAVSREAAAAVRGFAPDVEIVPNAVDVTGFAPTRRFPRRVAFVGRDDPRKGLDVLLDAWPAVRRTLPDAELIVIGANRDVAIEGVVFHGRVSEERKRLLLSSAAVYCAPNTGGESFGITLIEAMAAGCAIVASDLPAFIAVAGGVASHFPVGDRMRLADLLATVLDDDGTVRRMSDDARSRAELFDWGRILPRWIELYEGALERGHR